MQRLRSVKPQADGAKTSLSGQRTLQLLGMRRLGDRIFAADVAVDVQLLDRAVERLHTERSAGLDDVGNFENPVFANAVTHRGRAQHDLDARNHARLVAAL